MVNEPSVNASKRIIIRDSTLREGLDTPNVVFTTAQRLKIARLLDKINVPEIEIVAPGKVLRDLEFAKRLKEEELRITTSGLVYAYNPQCRQEIESASKYLDRLDILMPVSARRKPYGIEDKIECLGDVLPYALEFQPDVGVGFPHTTQTEVDLLLEIAIAAVKRGAKRVTLYDTNGSTDPFEIYRLIGRFKKDLSVPICFHGHNDLGLATANAFSAVQAGADILDVTINGLGDRAGNTSLEQIVMCLHLKGVYTGIILHGLKILSTTVAQESGIDVSKIAPVVGDYVFSHKSPSHLEYPELFEAFDPGILGLKRDLTTS